MQDFIAYLLRHRAFDKASKTRGRFRSFLAASLRNFLTNRHHASAAQKRGGGVEHVPLDALENLASVGHSSAEKALDHEWARLLVQKSLTLVEDGYRIRGRSAVYRQLRGFLPGDHPCPAKPALAAEWGVGMNAVDKAIHDLRVRFRDALRGLVSELVVDPADVDDELRYLILMMGN